jgi:NADH-quinone oxidoreductase subunit L
MFSSKASENQLLDHWTFAVFTSFGFSLFLRAITSNPAGIQISLFDWIQISNFKVDFGFY